MRVWSQYGGNPVSCAAALAVLDAIEKDRLRQNAVTVGNYLVEQLTQMQTRHELIGDVRCCCIHSPSSAF